uniref:Ras-related protein Rab-33 n=1 Tax=Meloidogyne incognita TaxID=6306 RepID=A0A914LJ13_MELIC
MNPVVETVEYRPQDHQTATNTNNKNEDNKASPSKNKEEMKDLTQIKRYPYNQPFPGAAEATKQVLEDDTNKNKMANLKFKGVGSYKSKRVFKVIIIGDAGVGKTCLSYRFCNGRFPGPTEATIGVDFRERSIIIDEELIRIQLWDTAGQERYRQSIVAHYYRNVNAVVFVYDINNVQSFKSLPAWILECKNHALTSGDDTPHILIGNKCDLQTTNNERIKTEQAQIFADENDMALFETSAFADSEADHIEAIFMTLVHKLRHSKPMHVQSNEERSLKGQQKILLKANEIGNEEDNEEEGMCC